MSQNRCMAQETIEKVGIEDSVVVLKTVKSVEATNADAIIIDPLAMLAMTQELFDAIVRKVGRDNIQLLKYQYNPADWRNPIVLPLERIQHWQKTCHCCGQAGA